MLFNTTGMFRALLVHHQGDSCLWQYDCENLRSRNKPLVVRGLYETNKRSGKNADFYDVKAGCKLAYGSGF